MFRCTGFLGRVGGGKRDLLIAGRDLEDGVCGRSFDDVFKLLRQIETFDAMDFRLDGEIEFGRYPLSHHDLGVIEAVLNHGAAVAIQLFNADGPGFPDILGFDAVGLEIGLGAEVSGLQEGPVGGLKRPDEFLVEPDDGDLNLVFKPQFLADGIVPDVDLAGVCPPVLGHRQIGGEGCGLRPVRNGEDRRDHEK